MQADNVTWLDSIKLFECHDNSITTNSFSIHTTGSYDDYQVSDCRLKFQIFNYKTKAKYFCFAPFSTIITLMDKINALIYNTENEKDNKQAIHTEIVKCRRFIEVTSVYRAEVRDICYRFSFYDQEHANKNDEIIYLSKTDINSVQLILDSFVKNYSMYINNYIMLKTCKQQLDKMDELKQVLRDIKFNINKTEGPQQKNIPDVEINAMPEQDELSEFMKNNVDKMELDVNLGSLIQQEEPTEKLNIVNNLLVTNKLCNGDGSTFETIINSCLNEPIPVVGLLNKVGATAILNVIPDKVKHEFYYINTRMLKSVVYNNLFGKLPIPISAPSCKFYHIETIEEQNINLCYELFCYCAIYNCIHSQLRDITDNTTNNKSILFFTIRSMFIPLSMLFLDKKINKPNFRGKCESIFKIIKDSGMIDSLIQSIKHSTTRDISIDDAGVMEYCDKVFSNIAQIESIDISMYRTLITKHIKPVNMFIGPKFDFSALTIDMLSDICNIESQFSCNGKVDLSVLKDMFGITTERINKIPTDILMSYNIDLNSLGANNLKRYIQNVMKDDKHLKEAIQLCSCIDTSYRDLNIDTKHNIMNYPDQAIIAFACWDIGLNPKIQTAYNQFVNTVNTSSLTRESALSLILNKQENITKQDYHTNVNLGDVGSFIKESK